MNFDQFSRGYDYYKCPIDEILKKDPVFIKNHPSSQQQIKIHSKSKIEEIIKMKGTCPFTNQKLFLEKCEFTSAAVEMLVFVLRAVKAFENPQELQPHLDGDIDDSVRNEFEAILKDFHGDATLKPFLIQAEQQLNALHPSKHMNSNLSIDSIGRLLSFGIEADYAEQQRLQAEAMENNREINRNLGQGSILLGAGKYQDAQEIFQNILKKDPKNLEALCCKKYAALKLGSADPTINFEADLRINQRNIIALCGQGVILLKLNTQAATNDALKHFRAALDIDHNCKDALFGISDALFRLDPNNNYNACVNNLQKILDSDPMHLEANLKMAAILLSNVKKFNVKSSLHLPREFNLAMGCCDRILAVNKEHVEALFLKANVLSIYGIKANTTAINNIALQLHQRHPTNIQIQLRIPEILFDKPSSYSDLILECYNKVLAQDRNNIEAYLGKIKYYECYDPARLKEMLECYEQILRIKPNDSNNLVKIIEVLKNMQFSTQADCKQDLKKYYLKLLILDPSNITNIFQYAELLFDLGEFEDAEPHLMQVLDANKNHIEANFIYAQILTKLKRFPENAITSFNKVIGANNALLDKASLALADLYISLNRHNDAIACYKHAINTIVKNAQTAVYFSSAITTRNKELYLKLAALLVKLNLELPEAENYYRQYIALHKPQICIASNLELGRLLIKANKHADAKSFIEPILQTAPNNISALLLLAELAIDNIAEVVNITKKILDIDSRNTQAYYCLANAYLKVENYNEAAKQYETIHAVDPLDQIAVTKYQECLAKLQEIREMQEMIVASPIATDADFNNALLSYDYTGHNLMESSADFGKRTFAMQSQPTALFSNAAITAASASGAAASSSGAAASSSGAAASSSGAAASASGAAASSSGAAASASGAAASSSGAAAASANSGMAAVAASAAANAKKAKTIAAQSDQQQAYPLWHANGIDLLGSYNVGAAAAAQPAAMQEEVPAFAAASSAAQPQAPILPLAAAAAAKNPTMAARKEAGSWWAPIMPDEALEQNYGNLPDLNLDCYF